MADRRPWSPTGEERRPGLAEPAANPVVTAFAVTIKLGSGNPSWPSRLGHPATGWAGAEQE
ncbi:hypothetical protein TIFTF001_024479 [Ficus carica]|uniref:Uncharacterized protein n=1 Tax=Ficus carica TaxID=3494 RepID=A0AA88DDB8_FICCA|nr:hypothetical protein TIFTF001_024479 [Ficus carica]